MERNNASFSGRILEKNPIFLYVKDYQNASRNDLLFLSAIFMSSFLVETFPAASSTHKIGIKVLQIQHRMFRICLKLTVTSHLRFCPREIWKVDFQSENFRGRYRYRFHFEWFSKLFILNYKNLSQIVLGIKSQKFPEFNLHIST